jgi:hypothetical protein
MSRLVKRKILLLAFVLLLASLFACTPRRHSSPYSPLENAGIQILSSSNPYHGPNVVLAQTLEDSPSLAGYFQHKGAPRAIQVKTARASLDKIIFYYPDDYGMYVATRRGGLIQEPTHADWMVAGPYRINRGDYRQIKNFTQPREKSPIFLVHGNVTRYRQGDITYNTAVVEPEIPLLPEPEPEEPPKKVVKEATPEEESLEKKESEKGKQNFFVNLDDPKFIPQNMDQQALLLSSGYAPRTSSGDIVHEVEGSAQMLENISDWYTGTTRNVAQIQEVSDLLPEQQEVRKGMRIRIPLNLITRTKKMPLSYRAAPEKPVEEVETKEPGDDEELVEDE